MGNPGNFQAKAGEAIQVLSVAFSDVASKDLHPESFMGVIYTGGVIVHILITFMITVIVFSFGAFLRSKKAAGKGNLDAYVVKSKRLTRQKQN